MREIKFRGKRIDNDKWIEGYYWTNGIGNHFIKVIKDKSGNFVSNSINNNFEVESNTVGQYTGLTDKNGTEIYDGDLLTDMGGDVFDVFYNAAHCAHMADYVRTKHAEKKRGYFRLGDQCSLTIEVIGNVWENPELLK